MMLPELREKIKHRSAKIAVIGLGYVGLPVACSFAEAGFEVVGVDIDVRRVQQINDSVNPIRGNEPGLQELLHRVTAGKAFHATSAYDEIRQADIILVSVETPVNDQHEPEYQALRSVCESLAVVISKGSLVIIESTVSPGTTDNLIRPILENASGLQVDRDIFLGTCPERVMPGKLLHNIQTMNRVCGGRTPETAETMVALYRTIVEGDLDKADTLTAELVKTSENAYRDVQIAFANEIALVCESLGADAWRVRELVNKSPNRNMHLPGAGVGGHCIPKDPWLLSYAVQDKENLLNVIRAARYTNDEMPSHVKRLLMDGLNAAGVNSADARVLILGYAYLEDSDDTRNSPSQALIELLNGDVAEVRIHDPYVPKFQGSIHEFAEKCDAVVMMVRHKPYLDLNLDTLKDSLRTRLFVDGRGVYNPSELLNKGYIYRGIGRSGQDENHFGTDQLH